VSVAEPDNRALMVPNELGVSAVTCLDNQSPDLTKIDFSAQNTTKSGTSDVTPCMIVSVAEPDNQGTDGPK